MQLSLLRLQGLMDKSITITEPQKSGLHVDLYMKSYICTCNVH